MLLWYCGSFERTPQSTVNQHFARRNPFHGFLLFLKEMITCLIIMAVSGKRKEKEY